MGQAAADDVQREHAPAILANRVLAERRWGRPRLAYNACIRPGHDATAALSAVQDGVIGAEPSLLRVPEHALHANVTWLLPVHQEFGSGKDELWRQHGPGWIAVLEEAASRTQRFRLRYGRLVATDSAVIAVAEQPNPLSELRRELAPVLRVPGGRAAGELVHTTLFRYAGPLRDPAAFIQLVAATTVSAETDVSEILIVRERIFPSLDYEILQRLTLPAGPAGQGITGGR